MPVVAATRRPDLARASRPRHAFGDAVSCAIAGQPDYNSQHSAPACAGHRRLGSRLRANALAVCPCLRPHPIRVLGPRLTRAGRRRCAASDLASVNLSPNALGSVLVHSFSAMACRTPTAAVTPLKPAALSPAVSVSKCDAAPGYLSRGSCASCLWRFGCWFLLAIVCGFW